LTPAAAKEPAAASRSAAATLAALGSDTVSGLSAAEAAARLTRDGPNEVAERKSHPLIAFARKFWGLSAWMIELIALISGVLQKFADLGVALGLLVLNAVLSFLQEQRASAAVTALRSRLQISARVLRDGEWAARPARDLVCGDIVRVRSGDFVPADLQLLGARVQVDQSALTGESREVEKRAHDVLLSGSIVRDGEATAIVTATGVRTLYGRTTELVEGARPKLHVEEVVTRLVRWLLLIVGGAVAVTIVVSLMRGERLLEILPLALVLLMSAIPVALPVMFTVSMAFGSMQLARVGVLVTRLSAAEDAATMDVLCADKTGTLTLNRLSFAGATPQRGFSVDDVVRYGAWASNAANADPIDLAFIGAAKDRKLAVEPAKVWSFSPFSAKTRRTEAVIDDRGRQVRVIKGALRTVAKLAGCKPSAIQALEAAAEVEAQKGRRALAVARADAAGTLRLVGLAFLYDAPRPDSPQLIDELRALGVTVKMLTGDALPVAREIAAELGLGTIARAPDLRAALGAGRAGAMSIAADSSGFAEVFPEDKHLIVKSLQDEGRVVGMTGDGVNDAPALRQAEVGIAVSGATDVAKGAASVVLTTEGLGGIVELVKNGRAIYQRVLTWIVNKVSRTILKAGFVVVAYLVTGQFVISALGMVLIVFMTDFVKIALSTDRVRPSQKPETWNIGPLIRVAVLIGALMLVEALGLLALGWRLFDLGSNPGQLQTFTFQTLLFFALFSIVSIRERRAFWASRPSKVLTVALTLDGAVGLLIGATGLAEMRPLPLEATGLIVAVALVFSLGVNDLAKTALILRTLRSAPLAEAPAKRAAGPRR
jgi:plasma-membrane proton-efflux P-type ATPase